MADSLRRGAAGKVCSFFMITARLARSDRAGHRSPGVPHNLARVLSGGVAQARSREVHFDGKRVVDVVGEQVEGDVG